MSKEVLIEIRNMLCMIILMLALELLVFFVFGFFDIAVLWGGLMGAAVAFINFFLLAFSVESSVKKAKKGAQVAMGGSYTIRLMFIAAAVIFAIKSPHINYLATLIPLLFPRIAIMIKEILKNKREVKTDERT